MCLKVFEVFDVQITINHHHRNHQPAPQQRGLTPALPDSSLTHTNVVYILYVYTHISALMVANHKTSNSQNQTRQQSIFVRRRMIFKSATKMGSR